MSRVHCELQEVRPDPHPGSGIHRGQVQDGPGPSVLAGGTDQRISIPCQILLQSWAVQTSPLFEPVGPHGCHLAVSGVRPPSHAPHPVVSEILVEPRNPWAVFHDPHRQGSQPRISVVAGQGTLFPGYDLITQHHHPHYRCKHGRVGWSLPTTRGDNGTLHHPLVQVITTTPHQRVRAQGGSPDLASSGAGDPRSVSVDRVRQYSHSVIHQQPGRSGLQDPQCRGLHSVRVGNPQVDQASGNSPARSQ